MGLLSNIIIKGVSTAARNATIKAVGNATMNIISAKASTQEQADDAVIKNGNLYIKPTRSSENYINADTLDVVKELLGVGFENINLKAVKKLGAYSAKKYGKVYSISINGNNDFLGIKKVPASSYIIIEFLDFKDSVSPEVSANMNRLRSGMVHSVADIENINDTIDGSPINSKKFCSYCGEAIQNENAKFCSACGKEL